jgi:uncharacterized protein (UPF0335 family)
VIDVITKRRIVKLRKADRAGVHVLENLAQFIDTHRDQPHVGVFFDDIHRGQCRPTPVDYLIEDDMLVNRETGEILRRHDKHMFVTNAYYSQFLIDTLMATGADPRDGNGCMPTSHFRDARAKVYELKSFREIIRLRALEEHVNI